MNRLGMIAILWTVVLAGCQSTGGTIGGLFPGPKLLTGEIAHNRYTSKDKMFSIQVSHSQNTYEYKYMAVKEQYADGGAYVSFGPAAYNKSVYRLEIATRLTPQSQAIELEKVLPEIIASTAVQLVKVYGTELELQSQDKTTINGSEAFHFVFTQEIPAGKFFKRERAVFTHEVYVIDLKTFAATLWVQLPPKDIPMPSAPALPPLAFAESLRVNTQ